MFKKCVIVACFPVDTIDTRKKNGYRFANMPRRIIIPYGTL